MKRVSAFFCKRRVLRVEEGMDDGGLIVYTLDGHEGSVGLGGGVVRCCFQLVCRVVYTAYNVSYR